MRVLVTGSAGFIGQHLVRYLSDEGYLVTGLDRRRPTEVPPGVEHIMCDLLNVAELVGAVQGAEPDVVVHLAATTHLDGKSLRDYDSNVAGVAHLARAIAATPSVERVIVTSTQLVRRIGAPPAVSDEDYAPSTVYGESKVETERTWRQADGVGRAWCITRPTTIWGPGMNPHYMTFFRMVEQGNYVHVGSRPLLKTYGFVGNTIRQYRALIDAPQDTIHRRTFYIGDYMPLDLRVWAEEFRAVLDAPRIRTIPLALASAVARVGDVISALGFKRFKFTTFRLRNVITQNVVDLRAIKGVCAELPYTEADGVRLTAEWLRDPPKTSLTPVS